MTDLTPVPWCINGIAVLGCGHVVLLDFDIQGWVAAVKFPPSLVCPKCPSPRNCVQRVINLMVRRG
jgi:hypothetical protein